MRWSFEKKLISYRRGSTSPIVVPPPFTPPPGVNPDEIGPRTYLDLDSVQNQPLLVEPPPPPPPSGQVQAPSCTQRPRKPRTQISNGDPNHITVSTFVEVFASP